MNDLGPLFVHPGEQLSMVSWLIPGGIAVLACAIALYALWKGRLPEYLTAAFATTLPLLAYALGNVVVMDLSKETEFCGSCHVMAPVVASVQGEDDSLASIHETLGALPSVRSCYTCHSGYGIWGDMNAKLAGVSHMVFNVIGSYEYPLKTRVAFDIKACLECHAESARFRAVEAHAVPDIQTALLAQEMSCTGTCHPPAHPAEALSGGAP